MDWGQGLAGGEYVLLWTGLVAAVMVIGLVGVLLPGLPGLILVLGAGVAYGFLFGFTTTAIVVLVFMTVLVIISVIKGLIIPARAASESGASRWSQVWAVVGGVTGFFLIPIFGLILGALAGLILSEFLVKGNWDEAWKATLGTAKGFGVSVLIDLALGTMMIAAWSVWAATVLL